MPRSSSWPAASWAGAPQRLHEVSRFVREGGRWYYLDGTLR